jgi:hypothetical protein
VDGLEAHGHENLVPRLPSHDIISALLDASRRHLLPNHTVTEIDDPANGADVRST